MQPHLVKRAPLVASPRELDAKLELLQQLGYEGRFHLSDDDDVHFSDHAICVNQDTDRWIQTEYNWAIEEAAESDASIPDLFDVEEDEEACLPHVYDPTFFAARQPLASPTRERAQSLSQPLRNDVDKPLPSVPPLRIRPRPSLPIVPSPSPALKSALSSPASSPPVSPRSIRGDTHSHPPSPRMASSPKSRTFPLSHGFPNPPSARPTVHRHATYPSISSTLSLLEERETEVEKRSGVYVADREDDSLQQTLPRSLGRGRSSSATVLGSGELSGTFPIGSSPRRKQRPALPSLLPSASSPQLRRLAELATTPSPSFSVASPLLPSPMDEDAANPEAEDVAPGEAITYPPLESPDDEAAAEIGLASRWSLDSVASRPRITQMALDDGASPASKTRKRDRLLSLISSRVRSGSVTKPFPPPNTPRVSSDVLDIRCSTSRDSPSSSTAAASRPLFTMPHKISMAPSLSSSNSSNGSSASTLATPVEPTHPSPLPDFLDPFEGDSHSCILPEELELEDEEGSLVFAKNPYIMPDSPLLLPESPTLDPSPLPLHEHEHEHEYEREHEREHEYEHPRPSPHPHPHEPLRLQIADRPMSPGSPPPEPTLPLPSPSTPSPSFLVPSPRPQSFFATITGRQKRRKRKLVVSGAPLEFSQAPRPSSSASPGQSSEDHYHRRIEQQRRVQNVVKWCESFGPLRKIDRKEDGSLHVYWKDWEVADMVCRVQAQVFIKDVGRVNLAWYYIS